MQQLQIAVQAYQGKDLDSAETIFKRILAINPNEPNALHLLGCICKDRGQLLQAVELIQASIQVDGSNPIPFLNLGKILTIAGQHENAAGLFQESLKKNQQIPEAWFCFANALREIQKVEEAKQAYRNALQLNPAHAGAASNLGSLLTDDGELEEAEQLFLAAIGQAPAYANLRINYGNLLTEKGDYPAAIIQYQIAVPLLPHSPELHYNLARALKEEGRIEAAADAFAEHHRLKPIAQSFSFASAVSPQPLNAALEVKVPGSAEFISSYVSDAIRFGMHLMYVHIPKAGGIRFSTPIFSCIQEFLLKGGWEKYRDLAASAFGRQEFAVMASHRIDSGPMRDGIAAAFSSYDLPSLDFSFLTPHGVSSRELSLAMRDQFDVQPIRLATWRDPRKRLKSALDYLYRTSEGDLDLVREKIGQKDPFVDNAIYRGCFSDFSPQVLPDERCNAQVDYLIDIGDFSVMNQIMSSFLSSNRLPNIVVNKKVNVTPGHRKLDAVSADSLVEQCVETGLISLDCAPVIEHMVSRVLPAEFDLQFDPSSASLHPLTFVVSAATDSKTSMKSYLLPTESLLTDEGQDFLRKIFA